jgi:hypothetical protein
MDNEPVWGLVAFAAFAVGLVLGAILRGLYG